MCALVAQRIEQLPSKQWVVGSIPSRGTIFLPSFYAQTDLPFQNLQKGAKICTFRKKLRQNYGKITTKLRHDLRPIFIYLHRKSAVFQTSLRRVAPVLLNSSRFHGIIPRTGIPPSRINYGGIYATHNTSSTRQGPVLCRTHPGTGPCRCRHLSSLFHAKTGVKTQ